MLPGSIRIREKADPDPIKRPRIHRSGSETLQKSSIINLKDEIEALKNQVMNNYLHF